jgi:hypothetical protein
MALLDDIEIQADKDIRWTGGATTTYTWLELHEGLGDLADDAAYAGDDILDISRQIASDRSTDQIFELVNGYNIDDTMAEHFYDGSLVQNGGDDKWGGLEVVGKTNSGNVEVIQNHALLTDHWTAKPNADTANNKVLRTSIRIRQDGADIDQRRIWVRAATFGDTYKWFNVQLGDGVSTAAIDTGDDPFNNTAEGTVGGWTITNTEGYQGLDIDADGSNENYYSKWDKGSQSINDVYEYAKYIIRDGTSETIHGMNGALFRGISHSFAYDNESGGPFTEDETIAWGTKFNYDGESGGPFTEGEFVTIGSGGAAGQLVYLQDDGATGTMYVALEDTSITVNDNDTVTGLTSAATCSVNGSVTDNDKGGGQGVLLALDDDGATGNMYIMLTRGVAPVDNLELIGLSSDATCDINGSVTSRSIPDSGVFIGQSTSTNIIGGYGIGYDPDDVGSSDQFTDLDGNQVVPPNNVTWDFTSVAIGDYVLVTDWDGSSYDTFGHPVPNKSQMSLSTTLSGATETSVVVASIPDNTPASGTLRVVTDGGVDKKISYSSYSGSTFTIPSTDFSSDNATSSNNVYLTYIDKVATATTESYTTVFGSAQNLAAFCRRGGASRIKPFATTSSQGSGGGSATAIRTSDT